MRSPTLPFISALALALLASLPSLIYAAPDVDATSSMPVKRSQSSGSPPTSSNIEAEYRGLQTGCQYELKKLMTSSSTIGSCTGIGQLVTDVIADGDAGSQSIIRPLSTWLSNACGTSGCTKGAVKQAAAAIKKGCAQDLQQKHYMAVVSLALLENYETTRKVACQKEKSADQYCMTQVMQDFQKASGKTFIPSYFSAVAAQPIAFLNSLKGTAYCTPCLNQIVVQSKPILLDIDEQSQEDVNELLVEKCKKKFDPDAKSGKDMTSATGNNALTYASSKGTQLLPADLELLLPLLSFLAMLV